MDDSTIQDMQSAPTILRIKRKRTDEPLDALVIESKSRRKKSRGPSGFFQFAETVEEETFWQDPSLTKDLRTRITTLANGETLVEKVEHEERPSPEVPGRRYTIVKKGLDATPSSSPVVQRAGQPEVVENGNDFTMYDAVPESSFSSSGSTELSDPEMAKFLPMLQEYLRLNGSPSNIADHATKRGDEYVWDVFYHRTVGADWAGAMNVATVSGLPSLGPYDEDSDEDSAGDEDDEDSNTEDFYRNDYPDGDPDQDSGDSDDSEEEYPEVSDEDEEDEMELNNFLASHRHR